MSTVIAFPTRPTVEFPAIDAPLVLETVGDIRVGLEGLPPELQAMALLRAAAEAFAESTIDARLPPQRAAEAMAQHATMAALHAGDLAKRWTEG